MRAKLFISEAVRSIGANISTTVAATMTVLIGMFLLGLFIALFSWVNSWTNHVRKDVIVKTFMTQEAVPQQINSVRAQLESFPETKSVRFISKDEAWALMKKRYPDLTKNVVHNPLPASFEVTPKSADQVETLAARLNPLPGGVDKVDYAQKKTKRILAVTNVIKYIFLLGSLILLAASTILIANTIRLSIFSRRREIEVMKLVGASNWFVRVPFMAEGLVQGAIGAGFAFGLVYFLKWIITRLLRNQHSLLRPFYASSHDVFVIGSWVLLIGAVIGVAGSMIGLRRFLEA